MDPGGRLNNWLARTKECELLINTTHRCNLKCRYCFVDDNYRAYQTNTEASVMVRQTQDASLKFIERLGKNFDAITLHFYGGEPFTYFEAMQRLTEDAFTAQKRIGAKVAFSVTTNGTLIDKDRAAFLDRFRYSVLISCDGSEKVHDAMRVTQNGKTTFAAVRNAIDLLKSHGNIRLGLSAVIHRFNRLSDAYLFLESLSPDFIKAEYVRVKEGHPFDLRNREKEIYFEDVRHIADKVAEDLIKGRVPIDYRFNSRLLQLWRQTVRHEFCGAGSSIFGIAANGDIYPCSLLIGIEDCLLGNVFKGLDQDKVRAFIKWHAATGKKGCQQCSVKDFCGGGCAAMWKTVQRGFCEYIKNEVDLASYIYDRVSSEKPESLALLVSRDFYEQLTIMIGEK